MTAPRTLCVRPLGVADRLGGPPAIANRSELVERREQQVVGIAALRL